LSRLPVIERSDSLFQPPCWQSDEAIE